MAPFLGMLLVSCAENTSTTANSAGIHLRNSTNTASQSLSSQWSAYQNRLASLKSRAGAGFYPARISASEVKRAAKLPRDKHGMPTYPDSVRTRVVRTTGYSHMEMEPGAPWRKNALGTYLQYGSLRSAAADWSVLPAGTRFKIKGLPYTYVVDDYGRSLVGTNTIDIYHPNLSLMKKWATRYVEMTIIQWGSWQETVSFLSKKTHRAHTRQMYYAARRKLTSGRVTIR